MNWEPSGNYLLIRLHKIGSGLTIVGNEAYNGLATVLDIGPKVEAPIVKGDVILINGPAGIIAHKELGEDVALVAAPLVLARQVGAVES